ncbi:MAG: phosphatase PAP2 family protein [Limosilactobacillus sp.]|uniref:phosphatase PAP2 family protein n=1 Tax=Limosilactobacillus sp. TaxID=2773925 RepID=UPI0027032325|nr:phosphatase PAP2 family protein [Limosilactobacillus sp.]
MNNYFEQYSKFQRWMENHPALIQILRWFNRCTVVVMYLSYVVMVATMACLRGLWAYPVLLVPGVGFILLTIVRKSLNAPRPYEKSGIEPLIKRGKKGDSFPSRHVFSATVISMVALWIAWPFGVVLMVLSVLLACARVMGGVHYPRDVVAGMLAGVICGLFLWMF